MINPATGGNRGFDGAHLSHCRQCPPAGSGVQPGTEKGDVSGKLTKRALGAAAQQGFRFMDVARADGEHGQWLGIPGQRQTL